jgi:hypothetical protein
VLEVQLNRKRCAAAHAWTASLNRLRRLRSCT